MEGVIFKALSGFYYVRSGDRVYECRARGKFRREGLSPLVGDKVGFSAEPSGKGCIDSVFERRNSFIRPAVANIDALVFIAANTNPVTDPFLIDRVSVIAENAGCELIVCINKTDIDPADELFSVYTRSGFTTVRTSAETGEGLDELKAAMKGKICAFTGNSGVGKSSILNKLVPELCLEVGEVSERLGRGRHTTRHVELFHIGDGTFVADTPGFASFEIEMMSSITRDELQHDFSDFAEFIGSCRYNDCVHLREPDCAVRKAVEDGRIEKSRYESYVRLYESINDNSWELK